MSAESRKLDRNEEIGLVYEHLNGMELPPQKLLTEVSNLKRVGNPVTEGEYADYRYQAVNDEKFDAMVPEIMAAVSKLKYMKSFITPKQREEIKAHNDAVRIEVCELVEKHAIPYILLDNVLSDIGGNVAGVFKSAVNTLNNKTGAVLMDIAKKRLGVDDVNMAHIAKYAEETYAEGKAKADAAKPDDGEAQAAQ